MKLKILLLLSLFLPSLLSAQVGATGGFTILNTSGATITNQPRSLAMTFRQGDIPNCVAINWGVEGGTIAPITSYGAYVTQTDVKNRWPDGSIKFAIVSFVIPTLAAGQMGYVTRDNQASCNNTGFLTQSLMLAAGFDFDGTITVTGTNNHSVSARAMLTTAGSCVDPGTDIDGSTALCVYWLKGPVVTAVKIEDRAGRSTDFNMDGLVGNPLHPRFEAWFYPQGNQVQLGYNLENEWASSTPTLSARKQTIATTTFNAGSAVPIPVYSQATSFVSYPFTFIRHTYCVNGTGKGNANVCGPSLHVDHNWGYLAETGVFPHYDPGLVLSSQTIASNTASNGFTSTIFGGCTSCYSGPKGGIGSYTTTMNSGGFDDMHGTMTSWELGYLISQNEGLFATVLANSDLGGDIPYWLREADHNAGHGQTFDNSGVAGSTETKGRMVSINARQQVNFLDMNQQGGTPPGETAWNSGTAYAAGAYVSNAGNHYYAAQASTNQTPVNNPLFWVQTAIFCTTDPAPRDWINIGAGGFDMGMWNIIAPNNGTTHWPDIAYVSYLMTGQYDYYEELIQQADYAFGWGPGCNGFPTLSNLRKGAAGYINAGEERGVNWGVRNLVWGASFAIDGSPEKAYLEDKLYNNIAVLEGMHDIPLDTPGSAGQTAAWTFGNTAQTANPAGRHFLNTTGQSPIGAWWTNTSYANSNEPMCGVSSSAGCSVPETADSNFQSGFSAYVQGLLVDLGYSSTAGLSLIMKMYIHMEIDPSMNMFLTGSYVHPTTISTANGGNWIPSFAAVQTFINPLTNPTSFSFIGPPGSTSYAVIGASCENPDENGFVMFPMALSYGVTYKMSDGPYTAAAAYQVAKNNYTTCANGTGGSGFSYAGGVGKVGSPKWDLTPKGTANFGSTVTTPTVANPTFSPVAGTYPSSVNVVIGTTTPAANICVTSDGSTPTTNGAGTCVHGNRYVGPVTVAVSGTLKAIGTLSGDSDSAVVSATYIISGGTGVFGSTIMKGNARVKP